MMSPFLTVFSAICLTALDFPTTPLPVKPGFSETVRKEKVCWGQQEQGLPPRLVGHRQVAGVQLTGCCCAHHLPKGSAALTSLGCRRSGFWVWVSPKGFEFRALVMGAPLKLEHRVLESAMESLGMRGKPQLSCLPAEKSTQYLRILQKKQQLQDP